MQVLAARELAEAVKKQQDEKEAEAKTKTAEEAALLYGRPEFGESKYFLRYMPVLAFWVLSYPLRVDLVPMFDCGSGLFLTRSSSSYCSSRRRSWLSHAIMEEVGHECTFLLWY